ncbi:MAG: alanyl-tRNA editing protein [Vicinamibacteraceae bacterium]
MTERLYYTDPTCLEFEASIVGIAQEEGRTLVRLDRTAFYPTSGGQPTDTGRLDEARVVDVLDREEAVVHVVEAPAETLGIGARVLGRIDGERRRDHMQQHTGQHVLSAAFVRLHDVPTVSFHLGSSTSTVDLAREVSGDAIEAAEEAASRVVWENRPVSVRFASEDEAVSLPLRKPSQRAGTLRLIDISDWDLSACGGTHVARTGEIGAIVVCDWERYKSGTRITFVCGRRALRRHRELRDAVSRASALLSVAPADVDTAVEKLVADARDLRKATRTLSQELSAMRAAALAERAEHVAGVELLVALLEGADAAALRTAAASLTAAPGRVVVLLTEARPAAIVVARSADAAGVDASALLRHLVDRFGGKGGGKRELAQGGGIDADRDAVAAEVARILTTVARGPFD